jgi:hypothetical protein
MSASLVAVVVPGSSAAGAANASSETEATSLQIQKWRAARQYAMLQDK